MKKYNVLRGGSWYDPHGGAASASRNYSLPGSRSYYFGFRVCTNSSPPRVVRGGSFLNRARNVRCAVRDRTDPGNWLVNSGFRVVIED